MRRYHLLIRGVSVFLVLCVVGAWMQKKRLDEMTIGLCPPEEEQFSLSLADRLLFQAVGVDTQRPLEAVGEMIPGLAVPEDAWAQPDDGEFASQIRFSAADNRMIRFSRGESDLPVILIYHTHTHEAYNSLNGTLYTEKTGQWRTTDEDFNIVKVGETLAELLRMQGFVVYHDRSDYEMPKLSGAYDRSLAGVEKIRAEHPEISVFIDVHRDAYHEGRIVSVDVDGKDCAQIMFVVGSGESTGFRDLPDLASNTNLAQNVMDELRSISPDLVRRMSNKTGRYNQHLSSACMLIEVGHNINTLEEALNSLPHLAESLKVVLAGLDE